MNKNKKTLQIALSSSVAIVAAAAILLTICIIFSHANVRIDCTEDGLYSLTNATKEALSHLNRNVTIRFYYSKDLAQMPVGFKNYAKRVDDMLREYEINAGKHLKVERLNPKPDSDAEDSATLDGVIGQGMDALGLDRSIYLGLAVRCGEQLAAIPFLNPEREDLLEYDLTRAIISVVNPARRKVGIMSSMKVMGGVENAQLLMQGQGGMAPAWYIATELKKQYSVSEIPLNATSIPDDIDILIVVHPKGVSDETQFALDQFVLRGGRLLAFLDPLNITDLQMQQQHQQRQYQMPESASTLPALLKAWNIEFTSDKVLLDKKCMTSIRRNASGETDSMPNILSLAEDNMQEKDPSTSQISSLILLDAGAFSGNAADGLQKSVLVASSTESELVEKYVTQRSGEDMLRDFNAGGTRNELVIRLTGNFKTAFPDGKPGKKDDKENKGEEKGGNFLKESAKPGAVILVADADMLYDAFCVSRTNIFGQTFYQPINHNVSLVQNMIEALSGDIALFEIRSRGVKQRPFVKVRDMELAASDKYKDEIRKFEEEVQNVQRQLYEMQRTRKSGDKELLSREQKQAMQTIRKKEAEARKNLKRLRRDMRRDVESLENRLMVLNIALMPALVIIFGVCLVFIRHHSR